MSPEDRIREMDLWSGPVTIAPLSGGITNLNFVVTDAGRHFVVRLGQDIPEHLVMRWNERALTEAAAAAGISPALRHAEPGLMVDVVVTRCTCKEHAGGGLGFYLNKNTTTKKSESPNI